ncbi:hypothetical protein FOL47_006911 [Perkinsus chesapeaki]|uniref:N-acetyltransferase domain-containing protein n=1 Tax=Perkinsus chesapeaki TaxID=330153 RepID=A0A7J6LPQ1_PERCH|nr:hypothetical protein FOL47_006911 [Perkinsus chesapeaki]
MELPHKLEPKEENAVRANMSDPKKKGRFGYIEQVEVDGAFQRRGIGSRLVSDTLAKAPTSTPDVLAVALEVDKMNKGAQALYEKLGFINVLEEENTYLFAYYYKKRRASQIESLNRN